MKFGFQGKAAFFGVLLLCKPILNEINDDAGKGSSSAPIPSALHSLS
jgi:hypothetical protein